MFLLQFLEKARDQGGTVPGGIGVEYRLACSGELYNRRVLAPDWRKSDITRVLLRLPFELFVASQPFSSYPQEICVRIVVDQVTEREEDSTGILHISTFLPDEEIVEDLCSLLTLL